MAVVSMKQLLESGVHFGHATRRWNPKMAPYIFTVRKDIHIIDLNKTAAEIEKAYAALYQIVADGGRVLFVGTKKQAQEAVREEAVRSGQFYVDHRWLGGTLTNFKTIRKRIKLLHDLYAQEEEGIFEKLPKKEVIQLVRKRDRLEKFLSGIKEMKAVPQALFVVDPRTESSAVLEARKLGIKVFGIVDTNCDPDLVDYVIPANDDAIRAVKLITWVMANAVVEALGGVVEKFDDEEVIDIAMDAKEKKAPKEKKERKPEPKKAAVKEEVKEEPKEQIVEEVKPEPKKATKKAVAKEDVVEEVKPEPKKTTKKAAAKEEVKEEVKEEPKKAAKKVAKKEEAEEVKEQPADLSKLTVVQLKELANSRGIKFDSKVKKADLIALLS